MKDRILVTGGAGFIGSNFIHYLMGNSDVEIINLDFLTYAGNLNNLSGLEGNKRYKFYHGDICDKKLVEKICVEENVNGIINFAAESHVDRSILDSTPFVETNVKGTVVLLDIAKKLEIPNFLQVSTDEVYGSLGKEGLFTESTPITTNSPYSASKGAADHFVHAYGHTFGMNVKITRCSNNYGPNQFPEKLIPLMILNALDGKDLPVYGDGKNVRDWLYVEDHCSAIWTVYTKGKTREVYNIGGKNEKQNIEIVNLLLDILNKPHSLIKYVKDRPGHDQRYAIDNNKIQTELGWEPSLTFEVGIEKTVKWYLDNLEWCRNILDGSYMDFYELQYGNQR